MVLLPCDQMGRFPLKEFTVLTAEQGGAIGESQVRGNPLKTLASRVRSWVLGAAAFYRSNKLDTTRLVIHWQVSQGPASLTRQEEETEIKVKCVQGPGHQMDRERVL